MSESDYMITESFFDAPAIEADGMPRLAEIEQVLVGSVTVRA